MASTCLRVPHSTSLPRHQEAAKPCSLTAAVVPTHVNGSRLVCTERLGDVLAAAKHAAPRRMVARCRAAAAAAAPEAAADGNTEEKQPQPNEFVSLGVDTAFLPGLTQMGISTPSPIQAAAMPHVLAGSNLAIQSYTGSGKTLAYLLPVLTLALRRAQRVYKQGHNEVGLQVVIVAPSQELAMQVVRVAQTLLPPEGRTMVQQCIGGANPKNQLLALQRNKPLIVVGTPGRLAEFMRTNVLRVLYTPLLVLDEADQLLAPQFAEDMATIHAQVGQRLGPRRPRRLESQDANTSTAGTQEPQTAAVHDVLSPQKRQTVLISATLSQTVLSQTDKWCPEPQYITAGGPAPTLAPITPAQEAKDKDAPDAPGWGWGVKGWDGPASDMVPKGQGSAGGVEGEGLVPSMPPHLKHYYMVVEERHKVDGLRRLVHAMDAKKALVFMNWQQRLKDVQFKLEARSLKVSVLHGEMPKVARQNGLNDFTRGRVRALVVSDVVARGLDIPQCDAVFHLELPSSAAHYAHRAGRTGRMGAPGSVISLVAPRDAWVIRKLADRLDVQIQEVHVSNGQLQVGADPSTQSKQKRPGKATGNAEEDEADLQDQPSKGLDSMHKQQQPQQQQQQQQQPRGWKSVGSKAVHGATDTQAVASSGKPAAGTQAAASSVSSGPGRQDSKAGKKGTTEGVAAKGARVIPDAKGEFEAVIYDDEDEIDMTPEDEADLETQLEEVRASASKKGGRGGRSGGGRRGGRGKGGELPEFLQSAMPAAQAGSKATTKQAAKPNKPSSVKAELAAELAELRAEKAALRQQRSKLGQEVV